MTPFKYKKTVLLILIIVGISNFAYAGEADWLEFDLYKKSDSLMVQLYLDQLLKEPIINQLNEGIDHIFSIKIGLFRPKKFWGEAKISERKTSYRISYQIITKEYTIVRYRENDSTVISVNSILNLFKYLNNEIEIPTTSLDSLESQRQYFVEIQINMVTMTSFNIKSETGQNESESSPVTYFFEKFLEITNFGREEFNTRSRNFMLKELYNR